MCCSNFPTSFPSQLFCRVTLDVLKWIYCFGIWAGLSPFAKYCVVAYMWEQYTSQCPHIQHVPLGWAQSTDHLMGICKGLCPVMHGVHWGDPASFFFFWFTITKEGNVSASGGFPACSSCNYGNLWERSSATCWISEQVTCLICKSRQLKWCKSFG